MCTEVNLPLLPDRGASHVVAWRDGRAVSQAELLRDVLALSQALSRVLSPALPPASADAPAAINLCLDRYWFAVAFLACAHRGVVNLLPSSNAPLHLAQLVEHNPGVIALGDQPEALMGGCPWLDVAQVVSSELALVGEAGRDVAPDAAVASLHEMPTVSAERVVARFHTSGSTGAPQACDKRFGLLFAGHQAAASAILALTGGSCPVVGTSSFRHMFGFEATVLLPLWAGGSLTGGTPFFPADVASDLAAQPSPALLVTTPYHLRKMLEADIEFPACAGVLSATAPLSPDLAKAAEARLRAPLLEIYGATELGMLATRRTSESATWTLLPGFSLASEEGGFIASGPSLAQPQALHDLVEPQGEACFRLIDRSSNLINVVGKRSSLGFLNQVLQSLPGVHDGVFCVPPDVAHHDVTRLAAFVVAPGLTSADVLAGLRPHIDPVFLPRPIVMLDALPRDANAKLPAAALRALQAEHLQRKG